jgi:hypothetical protein
VNRVVSKRVLFCVFACTVYVVLRCGFVSQSASLITPENSVAPLPLALGAGTLLFRLLGLFVLLPLGVYWGACALIDWGLKDRSQSR